MNEDCVGDNLECKGDVCKEKAQTKTFRDIGIQARVSCEEKKSQEATRTTRDQQQQTSIGSSCGTTTGDDAQEEKRKESNSSGATAKRVRLQSSVDTPTKDESTPGCK